MKVNEDKNTGVQSSETGELLKATPGPWRVFEHADSSGLLVGPPYAEDSLKGSVKNVCAISGGRRNGVTDQQRTNARLIAAAPDLLAELRNLLIAYHSLDEHKATIWECRNVLCVQGSAAIAIATGEQL